MSTRMTVNDGAQTLYSVVEQVHQLVGHQGGSATNDHIARHSPGSAATASSQSADLSAVRYFLQRAERPKVLAPAPMANHVFGREAFPPDDNEGNF